METPSSNVTAAAVKDTQPRKVSTLRRMVLYAIFCLSMFYDSFNLSAFFAATPVLKQHFGLIESAFQLTYASFLLIVSSRLAVMYASIPRVFSYCAYSRGDRAAD